MQKSFRRHSEINPIKLTNYFLQFYSDNLVRLEYIYSQAYFVILQDFCFIELTQEILKKVFVIVWPVMSQRIGRQFLTVIYTNNRTKIILKSFMVQNFILQGAL